MWIQTGRIFKLHVTTICLSCGRVEHEKLRFANRPRGRVFYGLCENCRKELGLGEDHGT